MKKTVAIGILGNLVEHHDKALFSLLAPFIGPLFFAASDPINALISTYGTLFVGMCTRPLGALFFGLIADRIGRAKALSLTLIGMACATASMGLIPTYAEIGIAAPILLAFFRALQNFFAAGESNTAGVFVVEHTQMSLKSFISSLLEASTILGILLASLELTVCGALGILENYWRLLFLMGGVLGLIGYYFRSQAMEPEDFRNASDLPIFSLKEFLAETKPLLAIMLASGFSSATYVMSITFMNSFLTVISPLSVSALSGLNTLLLTLDLLLLPLFGYLSMRWGAEKMMLFASVATAILAVPLFQLLAWPTLPNILLIRCSIVILGVAFAACLRAWTQTLLPPKKRCSVISVGCATAHLLVEGTMTLLSLWLFSVLGSVAAPGMILSLLACGAAGAVFAYRKKEVAA